MPLYRSAKVALNSSDNKIFIRKNVNMAIKIIGN